MKFKYFFRQDLQDCLGFCAFPEGRHKPNRPADKNFSIVSPTLFYNVSLIVIPAKAGIQVGNSRFIISPRYQGCKVMPEMVHVILLILLDNIFYKRILICRH